MEIHPNKKRDPIQPRNTNRRLRSMIFKEEKYKPNLVADNDLCEKITATCC